MSSLAALRERLDKLSQNTREVTKADSSASDGNTSTNTSEKCITDHSIRMAQIAAGGNHPEAWLEYLDFLKTNVTFPDNISRHDFFWSIYENALKSIPVNENRRNWAYAKLFIDYAHLKSLVSPFEAETLFECARKIVWRFAVVHVAAAEFELLEDNRHKAKRILEKALLLNVDSKDLLRSALQRLQEGQQCLLSDSERNASFHSVNKDSDESSPSGDLASQPAYSSEPPPPYPSDICMKEEASGHQPPSNPGSSQTTSSSLSRQSRLRGPARVKRLDPYFQNFLEEEEDERQAAETTLDNFKPLASQKLHPKPPQRLPLSDIDTASDQSLLRTMKLRHRGQQAALSREGSETPARPAGAAELSGGFQTGAKMLSRPQDGLPGSGLRSQNQTGELSGTLGRLQNRIEFSGTLGRQQSRTELSGNLGQLQNQMEHSGTLGRQQSRTELSGTLGRLQNHMEHSGTLGRQQSQTELSGTLGRLLSRTEQSGTLGRQQSQTELSGTLGRLQSRTEHSGTLGRQQSRTKKCQEHSGMLGHLQELLTPYLHSADHSSATLEFREQRGSAMFPSDTPRDTSSSTTTTATDLTSNKGDSTLGEASQAPSLHAPRATGQPGPSLQAPESQKQPLAPLSMERSSFLKPATIPAQTEIRASSTAPPPSRSVAHSNPPQPPSVPVPLPATPASVSATPAPVSATPAPVSAMPAPVSATPAPFSATPASVSATPAPVPAMPAPFSAMPAPVSATPAPVSAMPAPFSATPAPVSATPAPVSATPAPVSATPAPVSATPAPVSATPAPFSATPAPLSATPAPFPAMPAPVSAMPAVAPAATVASVPVAVPVPTPVFAPSAPPAPAPVPAVAPAPVVARAAPVLPTMDTSNSIVVNGKPYVALTLSGRGGSAKVYKVLGPDRNIYALKCVDLNDAPPQVAEGYKNEIKLLQQLQYCPSVIKLFDYEFDDVQNCLKVVLEFGETDLNSFFHSRHREGNSFNDLLISFYWQEMLRAVHALHKEGVIHSDLKPANFLLVQGNLKLIDFGIANAIQPDRTSILLTTPLGTLSYMSPEAIMDTYEGTNVNEEGNIIPKYKISVQSDVWSLGCILYNMVYGRTPFQHVPNKAKVHAIISPKFPIEFPSISNKLLLDVLKKCLTRDPKLRPTTEELLAHPFLSSRKKTEESPVASVLTPTSMKRLMLQMTQASPGSVQALSKNILQQLEMGESLDLSLLTSSTKKQKTSAEPRASQSAVSQRKPEGSQPPSSTLPPSSMLPPSSTLPPSSGRVVHSTSKAPPPPSQFKVRQVRKPLNCINLFPQK